MQYRKKEWIRLAKERIEDQVSLLAEPIATSLGMELVDVEFVKEGGDWYLRIFIDKEAGVELDDCALVSNRLSEALDEKDLITQFYHLEVSSPGLERPLKKDGDFERFRGSKVFIQTYGPVNGKKKFEGMLIGLSEEGNIEITTPEGNLSIPRDKTSIVRLAVEF